MYLQLLLLNLFWVSFRVTTIEELRSNSQPGNYDVGKKRGWGMKDWVIRDREERGGY